MFLVSVPQNDDVAKFQILFTPPGQYFFLSHFVGRFKMQAGKEVQQSGCRGRRRIASVYHEK